MKYAAFLSLIFLLLSSCAQSDTPKPVVKISPPLGNPIEDNISMPENAPIVGTITVPTLAYEPSGYDWKQSIKNRIRESSKNFGLSDLEKSKFAEDDLEIRVWNISDLYMPIYKDLAVSKGVFVLKRSNGKWSAIINRNTVKFVKKSEVVKTIRTKLDEPKTGWEEFWKKLKDAEILTLSNAEDAGFNGCLDCPTLALETKVDKNYRFYIHPDVTKNGEKVRKSELMLAIMNLIADEFGAEDFRTRPPKLN